MVSVVSRIQEYLSPSRKYYSSSHLSQWKSIVRGINIAFSLLKVLSCIFLFTLTLKNNVLSPPRPSYFVLYNTLESDVALAYLPMATVTIAVVEMIMSLVLDHENKKLIWRALNLVHEVEFNEKWKACKNPNLKILNFLASTSKFYNKSRTSFQIFSPNT